MKKILAVSGGVDSMVLLDIFKDDPDAVVAHFNHGTRPSSDDDEAFVKAAAKNLGLPFFSKKEQLGANVSEAHARDRRWQFFDSIRKNLGDDALIFTAHHLTDLAETVTINFIRGTGWRGLAPFGQTENARHPFLDPNLLPKDLKSPMSRRDILRYAAKHNVKFREDPTNHEGKNLRSRIRENFANIPPVEAEEILKKVYSLWQSQWMIRNEIEEIEYEYLYDGSARIRDFKRQPFMDMDGQVAMELLKMMVDATGPTQRRLLDAIRTYAPEKKFNLPKNRRNDPQLVEIHKTYFRIP